MKNLELVNAFVDKKELFKQGGKTLRREAINNGFKTNPIGISTFLSNCELDTEVENFYQLCIPYAIDMSNQVLSPNQTLEMLGTKEEFEISRGVDIVDEELDEKLRTEEQEERLAEIRGEFGVDDYELNN